MPVSGTPRSPRCRGAVAARRPPGVLRWHHRGCLRHIRPLAGFVNGSLKPTSGLRRPDASSPTSTHPSGPAGVADQRSALRLVARGAQGCPRTVETAPVSSILLLHQRRDHIARMVEHPTEAVTSTLERPSLRGVVHTHPSRSLSGVSPAGDQDWEAGPSVRVVTDATRPRPRPTPARWPRGRSRRRALPRLGVCTPAPPARKGSPTYPGEPGDIGRRHA